MADETCEPFWTAFKKSTELDFCFEPVAAFDHPEPIMYDWSGDRQSALSVSHSVASGGELVDGTPASAFGTAMVVSYADQEVGYNYGAYIAVHDLDPAVSGSGTGPYDVRVTLVTTGGTRYDKFLSVSAPQNGDGSNNGAYSVDSTGNPSSNPELSDLATVFRLDGPAVASIEVEPIENLVQGEGGTSYSLRDGVSIALVHASTDAPT